MTSSNTNLLVSLNKWASGQQENFLTESFVHLLNALAQNSPVAFVSMISLMSDRKINPPADLTNQFIVTSQVDTDEGTPDIEISGPDSYILIEVKDESPIYMEQIERYYRVLEENKTRDKCLILLTKYQTSSITGSVIKLRWTQIAEWLLKINDEIEEEATNYIVRQFIEFLEYRGMSVNKAGWEMVAGIEQFRNFKTLLKHSMESAGAHRVWSAYGADFNGWAIPDPESNSSKYYVFVEFENPRRLIFSCPPDEVLENYRDEWIERGRNQLEKIIDLGSEEIHFFARELDSQREVLENFVATCLSQTHYQADTK